jgi:hypothetical protein
VAVVVARVSVVAVVDTGLEEGCITAGQEEGEEQPAEEHNSVAVKAYWGGTFP